MVLRFVLMVNKQGQTRLAQYYERLPMDERCALEAEVIRKCLSRTETQCSFFEYRGYKVVYRRYASLFFIVGVEGEDENELSILEFIHALVETLDRYFECVPPHSTASTVQAVLTPARRRADPIPAAVRSCAAHTYARAFRLAKNVRGSPAHLPTPETRQTAPSAARGAASASQGVALRVHAPSTDPRMAPAGTCVSWI